MKSSLKCPKCAHRKLWRIERFKTRGQANFCEVPVAATKLSIWTGNDYEGYFDAFVCSRCGYTEFYARDFEALAHDPAQGIYRIDGTMPEGDPFR